MQSHPPCHHPLNVPSRVEHGDWHDLPSRHIVGRVGGRQVRVGLQMQKEGDECLLLVCKGCAACRGRLVIRESHGILWWGCVAVRDKEMSRVSSQITSTQSQLLRLGGIKGVESEGWAWAQWGLLSHFSHLGHLTGTQHMPQGLGAE